MVYAFYFFVVLSIHISNHYDISCEDALFFGGVRCTYWSLGESLKPGGQVNNFVLVAFCYHLFCRPYGHPDVSKRHYFFSNILVSVFIYYVLVSSYICKLLISKF